MNLTALIINVLLFSCIVAVPVLRYFKSKYFKLTDPQYILLLCLFCVYNKFHLVLSNYPLNEDEAMNFAGGLSLLRFDPVLWRSVDFFTIGPMHVLYFILPELAGFASDYTNIRFVWLIINLVILVFVFKSCDLAFGERLKGVAFLYPFLFFAFGNIINLNHFTNESTSVLLISAGAYFLIRKIKEKTSRLYTDLIFYALMGLVPYCKLQGVPIALVMSGIYLFYGIRHSGGSKVVYFFKACIGGTFPTLLLVIYLGYFGQLDNFVNFYILSNFSYGYQSFILDNVFLTFVVRGTSEFPINYFLKHFYFLIFLLLCAVVVRDRFKNGLNNAVFLLFLSTVYSISKPGYAYGHYFVFLMTTFPLGIGIMIREAERLLNKWKLSSGFLIGAYLVLCTTIFYFNAKFYWESNTYSVAFERLVKPRAAIPLSKSAEELLLLKAKLKQEPKMVIFDWWPRLHISTGIVQATHQNVPERLFGFQAAGDKSSDFAKKIFLEDIVRNKPEFFLIATKTERAYFDFRYSNFYKIPKIKSYFDANYFFYKNLDDMDIYIRNDLKKTLL